MKGKNKILSPCNIDQKPHVVWDRDVLAMDSKAGRRIDAFQTPTKDFGRRDSNRFRTARLAYYLMAHSEIWETSSIRKK